MIPSFFNAEFRGHATPLSPGVLVVRASAPRGPFDQAEALLEARLTLLGEGAYDVAGSVAFGPSGSLRFRSVGLGVLASLAGPGVRHGAIVCSIESGDGSFVGVSGRMTSNFLLGGDGEITDRQVYLLALPLPVLGGVS